MQLGIFAKTFKRPTLEENLEAVKSHGFECVQYNMLCAGLTTLPQELDDELCGRIRESMEARGLAMASISGTFNIIDPSRERYEADLRGLQTVAGACSALRTSVITICTGTRDPDNMWRRHADNDTPEAWRDMVASMQSVVAIAEETGVTVAFEPEVNNVVDSAVRARRLLDEIGSPNLKVVMDGANLFHEGELKRMHEVLDEAFDLLGNDIAIAHAKDLRHDGDAGHEAAGTGMLDYDYYLASLKRCGFDGALIAHGLSEAQVPQCVSFLRDKLSLLQCER